ncbi:MAG TPA: hypothetical protein VFA53_06030 [Xanthobacteraceae bacterium]|nr:hypothetical protein [Xanthobacteraceae bacterium]
MRDRMRYYVFDWLGFLLCELAFKTDCRGPFAFAYRMGCWCYGFATDAGIRCGALIANPGYRPGGDEPLYVRR